MLNLKDIIIRKPERLQFLIMALLNDTYQEGMHSIFVGLCQETDRSQKILENLRMHANSVIIDIQEVFADFLTIKCMFKGHAGYPGGEFSKELHTVHMNIQTDVLQYLLHSMTMEIEQAQADYIKALNDRE